MPEELQAYRFSFDLLKGVGALREGYQGAQLIHDPEVGCPYLIIPMQADLAGGQLPLRPWERECVRLMVSPKAPGRLIKALGGGEQGAVAFKLAHQARKACGGSP
jgi:hypothetical protein